MSHRRSSSRGKRRPNEARPNRHSGDPGSAVDGAIARLSEEDLIERCEAAVPADEPLLLLVLDGVQDPHNLGACLRTAECAGAAAVLVPRHQSCRVTDTVVRVACGAAAHVPVVAVTNLARTLEKLSENLVQVIGTSDRAVDDLYDIDLSGPVALVLGAEESGIRRLTAERCDRLIRIPMAGHVECLNVSAAAAVCLFEAVRQRSLELS